MKFWKKLFKASTPQDTTPPAEMTASEMGRRGGTARMVKVSKARRRAIAKNAANARWKEKRETEKERLRQKRANAEYLKQERRRNADRMRLIRRSEMAPEPRSDRPKMEPITVSVQEAIDLISLSCTTIYKLMSENKLVRVKVGHRTLIRYDSIKRLLAVSDDTSAAE